MGTLAQKLQYTIKAVDDIQKALKGKGFDMSNVELSRYGSLIRLITGESSSGGGSSTGNEGQPLGGFKLDNVILMNKQNIILSTAKDKIYSYIKTFKQNTYTNNYLCCEYKNPETTYFAHITQKENTNIKTNINALMISKQNTYINILNIIEQED